MEQGSTTWKDYCQPSSTPFLYLPFIFDLVSDSLLSDATEILTAGKARHLNGQLVVLKHP
jgi:hypothetical protein